MWVELSVQSCIWWKGAVILHIKQFFSWIILSHLWSKLFPTLLQGTPVPTWFYLLWTGITSAQKWITACYPTVSLGSELRWNSIFFSIYFNSFALFVHALMSGEYFYCIFSVSGCEAFFLMSSRSAFLDNMWSTLDLYSFCFKKLLRKKGLKYLIKFLKSDMQL